MTGERDTRPAADPAPGLLPDPVLLELVQLGLTFEEIAAECVRVTSVTVSTSTLNAALSRATLMQTTGHRYFDAIPWRVRPEHSAVEPARMLRLLGRRCSGFPLDPVSAGRLESWLTRIWSQHAIVAYCPADEDGFVYVDEMLRRGPNPDIPIRVPPISLHEVAHVRVDLD